MNTTAQAQNDTNMEFILFMSELQANTPGTDKKLLQTARKL